jgi:tetratricopeptide (TPR) repeat protein
MMFAMNRLPLKLLAVFLLFTALGFSIYSNTLESPFVFDDLVRIRENPYIHLTQLNLEDILKVGFSKKSSKNRPVGNISFALNYYFHKYDLKGYHIVNIIIHVLSGFFLYLFLKITLNLPTVRSRYEHPDLIAFLAALLWLVHPVNTQSVTYIVQRLNSMAAMFYVLSLLLYLQGRLSQKQPRNWLWFTGSALSWILALGCKQNSATLPFFVFLYEWYFFQNLDRQWLKQNLKYVIGIVLIFGIIAFLYLGQNPLEKITSFKDFSNKEFTFTERVLTQFRVVIYYLNLFFFPHPSRLNLDHDFPLSHSLFNPVTTVLSLCFIIGLVGLALFLAKKERLISFGIFWFFANLAIESSIIPLAIIFEHRTYLPYMLVGAVSVLLIYRYIKIDWLKLGLLSAVVILFAVWTYERNSVWKDPVTFWKDCVEKSPNKARPRSNLGLALMREGTIEEAIVQFRKGLQINPDIAETHLGLGEALARQGNTDEAIHHYLEAIRKRPTFAGAYNKLGILMADQGKTAEAIHYYNKALQLKPEHLEAHNNLGIALADQGNSVEAIRHYRTALQIDPDFAEAHNNLAILLAKEGKPSEAIEYYTKALQLNPDYAEAHLNLGAVQAEQGNIDDAIEHYLAAIRIDPDYMKAHYNLAKVLTKQDKTEEAIRHFFEALRINPDYAEGHYDLGFILANKGRAEEAIKHFSEALRIDPEYADAHNNLGAVLLLKGKTEEAIFHFQEALKLKPQLADAHINMGVAYTHKGRLAEATSYFQKALRIKPDATDAQINLNNVKALLEKIDKAIVRAQKALKRHPNNSKLHYQLGTLYQNKGEVDKAIDQFKKAISLHPEFAEAINDLAVMYAIKGEYKKALPLFKKTVALRPNDLGTYYNISRLYAIQNDSKESINWLKKAVEKGFADWQRLETDESFKDIRGSSEYKSLVEGH